jgi:hypothetical protein
MPERVVVVVVVVVVARLLLLERQCKYQYDSMPAQMGLNLSVLSCVV